MVYDTDGTITSFGTCGNFKFEFVNLTDVKATRNIIKPKHCRNVGFVTSINTTDGTDLLKAQTLNWTGAADSTVAGQIPDSGEIFDGILGGVIAENTDDNYQGLVHRASDTNLYAVQAAGNDGSYASTALFINTKNYIIRNDRVIECIAQDANDDGRLIIFGW